MDKTYTGTKTIKARPMTRADAEALLGRVIGGAREGAGYLVTYPDGYQSWSPADVFEAAYSVTDTALDRVILERKELDAKLEKLGAFFNVKTFLALPEESRNLLHMQHRVMADYSLILGQRIELMQQPASEAQSAA